MDVEMLAPEPNRASQTPPFIWQDRTLKSCCDAKLEELPWTRYEREGITTNTRAATLVAQYVACGLACPMKGCNWERMASQGLQRPRDCSCVNKDEVEKIMRHWETCHYEYPAEVNARCVWDNCNATFRWSDKGVVKRHLKQLHGQDKQCPEVLNSMTNSIMLTCSSADVKGINMPASLARTARLTGLRRQWESRDPRWKGAVFETYKYVDSRAREQARRVRERKCGTCKSPKEAARKGNFYRWPGRDPLKDAAQGDTPSDELFESVAALECGPDADLKELLWAMRRDGVAPYLPEFIRDKGAQELADLDPTAKAKGTEDDAASVASETAPDPEKESERGRPATRSGAAKRTRSGRSQSAAASARDSKAAGTGEPVTAPQKKRKEVPASEPPAPEEPTVVTKPAAAPAAETKSSKKKKGKAKKPAAKAKAKPPPKSKEFVESSDSSAEEVDDGFQLVPGKGKGRGKSSAPPAADAPGAAKQVGKQSSLPTVPPRRTGGTPIDQRRREEEQRLDQMAPELSARIQRQHAREAEQRARAHKTNVARDIVAQRKKAVPARRSQTLRRRGMESLRRWEQFHWRFNVPHLRSSLRGDMSVPGKEVEETALQSQLVHISWLMEEVRTRLAPEGENVEELSTYMKGHELAPALAAFWRAQGKEVPKSVAPCELKGTGKPAAAPAAAGAPAAATAKAVEVKAPAKEVTPPPAAKATQPQ